jgi:hypothetical protein
MNQRRKKMEPTFPSWPSDEVLQKECGHLLYPAFLRGFTTTLLARCFMANLPAAPGDYRCDPNSRRSNRADR